MYIPKVLDAAFLKEQFRWLLLNYAVVPENIFLKKKVNEEIAFELISSFHVQK